jgi:hypothetical protein
VVTINTSGLQAVLTEYAELYSTNGLLPTLKLFLQLSRASSSPSEDLSNIHAYNATGTSTFRSKSSSASNISINSLNSSGNNISFYSSSPRNGMMNGHVMGNGHLGGNPRRNSSNFGLNPNDDIHHHPGKLDLDMAYIGNAPALDVVENTPPFRTPPRTPPDSPRNPLRTPPGSPKGISH